jgi:hypothetical protein
MELSVLKILFSKRWVETPRALVGEAEKVCQHT